MNPEEKNQRWAAVKARITDNKGLSRLLHLWRMQGHRIVFTNGCFDLLHLGHVEYLAKAASMGNKLVVGLNSDGSVRKLKGVNRPIQDLESRAHILASLAFVDVVVPFEEDTPELLIEQVKPDILVKGGDWAPESIVGYNFVRGYGGQVLSIPLVEGRSTTNIEMKIKS
ncbi:MAG: D-glycero-beta-D-manno-heptose 1-phosphate adenylyltransferase [Bacteroidota bacterium]|jgi:rfaE bifunctional protein nucleotidyltransferase chain/domain